MNIMSGGKRRAREWGGVGLGGRCGFHLCSNPLCYRRNKSCGWKTFVALDAENWLCNSIQAAATCLERTCRLFIFWWVRVDATGTLWSCAATKRGEMITKKITVGESDVSVCWSFLEPLDTHRKAIDCRSSTVHVIYCLSPVFKYYYLFYKCFNFKMIQN